MVKTRGVGCCLSNREIGQTKELLGAVYERYWLGGSPYGTGQIKVLLVISKNELVMQL